MPITTNGVNHPARWIRAKGRGEPRGGAEDSLASAPETVDEQCQLLQTASTTRADRYNEGSGLEIATLKTASERWATWR